MPHTRLSLGGNYDVIYKLFLPRKSLVSDIPAGNGNIKSFFYGVLIYDFATAPFLNFLIYEENLCIAPMV
jgi:hypothetical protein